MRAALVGLVCTVAVTGFAAPEALASQQAWTRVLNPGGSPPSGVLYTRAVYDSVNQRMVVAYGTTDNTCSTSQDFLYLLDFSASRDGQWARLNPSGSRPGTRSSCFLAYDDADQRMIMFGGSDSGCNPLQDVWELSLVKGQEAWRQLSVSGTPPTGSRHGFQVYDPGAKRAIYFGGERFNPSQDYYNEVFALDLSTPGAAYWQRITPTGTPPSPRSQGVAVFDSKLRRMIMFGGGRDHYGLAPAVYNDVFSLFLAPGNERWEVPGQSGTTPAGRAGVAAEFVSSINRLWVFGGGGGSFFSRTGYSDMFLLGLAAPNSWEQISPVGHQPQQLWNMATCYDQHRNRVVVFGGGTGNYGLSTSWYPSNLTWEVSFDDPNQPTPTPTPGATATPTPDNDPLNLSLRTNQSDYRQWDTLRVYWQQWNRTASGYEVDVFLAAEIAGQFYFHPTYTNWASPAKQASLPSGTTLPEEQVVVLPLADPLPAEIPITWYAAMLDRSSYQLLGDLRSVSIRLLP